MSERSRIALDPLIGREDDLQRIVAAVAASRLVTLTGPGGTGKSRLADAVIQAVRDAGRQGWFVGCGELDDASLIVPTVLAAMDIVDASGRLPMASLVDAIGDGEIVLALDNMEQLEGAGHIVTDLLGALPGLRVLATSRVPMGVRGESDFPIAPLDVPSDDSPAAVRGSSGGRLFFARAGGRLAPDAMDDQAAHEIAVLLRRLDGLPLAIELAAARTLALTPAELNARLDAQGPEAVDDGRDTQRRSVRVIVEWTIAQVSPAETEVLQAAAVCAGFDLSLVEALVPDQDVLPPIESLLSLGLVHRADVVAGTSRFRMLQTIQASALRRMDPGRRAVLQQRHAAHVLQVADVWQEAVRRRSVDGVAAAFNADADNVRRALDHLEADDPAAGLVLLTRLEPFWASTGRQREGYERFRRARDRLPTPTLDLVRAAAAQYAGGTFLLSPTELGALNDWILTWARTLGDQHTLAVALRDLALRAFHESDPARSAAAVAELRQVADTESPEDRILLLAAEAWHASLVDGPTSDRRVDLLRELAAELDLAGQVASHAACLMNLSGVLIGRGEFDEALALALASAASERALDRPPDYAATLALVGPCLAGLGRLDEAVDAALACAEASVEVGYDENLAWAIWSAIPVAVAVGMPTVAARLAGCLERGMHARGEADLTDLDRQLLDTWLRQARAGATELEIELALREGETEVPLALVRSLPERFATGQRRSAPTSRLPHGLLTKREVEILALVGRGRTDPEIAAELFISPKTASVHVANIKGKLGVETRLQIALRARDMGLVEATSASVNPR